MTFQRAIFSQLIEGFSRQKVSMLIGARRVGKTEMIRELAAHFGSKLLFLNGEDADTAALLENRTISNYQRLLQGYEYLVIDEAQYIPEIGLKAKLMIDNIQPLHILLTGSSAYDLVQQGEPLTGRTITFQLFPIAQMELKATENLLQTRQSLEERLIYGAYPETLTATSINAKKLYLNELVNTYLLKDLLAFEDIRQSSKISDMLKLLAFQVGNEVNNEELGRNLGISKNTVERYLDLLSKVFIIYQRKGFSRNLRKEVVKSSKWYFFDNGVRNALISQFQPLALRQDTGQLWENYLLSERIKFHAYNQQLVNSYFWRTYDQQEIDLVEEQDGNLFAYECKWKEEKAKIATAFAKAYPDAGFELINQQNYLPWIGG
jgi:predicted AAA+ superfamily ATPase